MKIIQWNINGFNNNLAELQLLLGMEHPDVICLQETHIKNNNVPNLKKMKWITKNSTISHKARGGVAIGFAEHISYKPLVLVTDLEAVAARITGKIIFTICSLYLPPNAAVMGYDLDMIFAQLPPPILLVGDLNAHSSLWGSNHSNRLGKLVENCLLQHNVTLLNNGSHTHISTAYGTTSAIDLSICSPQISTKLHWSVCSDSYNSDHYPIKIQTTPPLQKPVNSLKWCLKKANWEKFTENVVLTNNILDLDIDETVKLFTQAIITAAELSIPRTKPSKKMPVPWFTPDVKEAVKKRRTALKKFRKNMTTENLTEYKKTKKEATQIILVTKKECWKKFASQVNRDTPTSTVWKVIKRMSGNYIPNRIDCLHVNDTLITAENEIANQLAKYFASISSNASYTIEFREIKKQTEAIPIPIETNDEAYNKELTYREMEHCLRVTKNSSPGKDSISYSMIRNLPGYAKQLLLKIFNKIWMEENFPAMWRQSLIIPFVKPGKERTSPESYRPIALTSCVCKLLEKMVSQRLSWVLESKHIIIKQQCGFRRNRSTSDNLMKIEDDIQKAFQNRQHLICVFFDISKAYDTAWKRNIVNKLLNWGINGRITKFINNFLTDRSIQVRNNEHVSEYYAQVNGIPQGSVLSCLLFLIAMNDVLQNQGPQIKACVYADDIAIYSTSRNLEALGVTLQDSIQKLEDWSRTVGFSFAPNKTKAMHFTNLRKYKERPVLKIMSQEIEYVDNTTFLGLQLDTKLTWLHHIKNLRIKCLKKLNILKFLSGVTWGGDRQTLLHLHKSLIISKIDYGAEIYGGACQTYLKMLDSVHALGIRIATGAFRTSPVISVLVEAGQKPLEYRRMKILTNKILKVKSIEEHPNRHKFKHHNNIRILLRKMSMQRRLNLILNLTDTTFPKLFETPNIQKTPPWETPNYKVYDNLIKSDTNPNTTYATIKNKFPDSEYIYTDGSLTNNGVGCAFVTDRETFMYGLPKGTSIYSAEAYALKMSVEYAISASKTAESTKFLILTDSKSSLQNLKSQGSHNPHLGNIGNILYKQHHTTVAFLWIPSHKGIPGNEKADQAAKQACLLPPCTTRLIRQDASNYLNKAIDNIWSRHWNKVMDNKLKEIKYDTGTWSSSNRNSRKEEVTICRLRIGHTRATHGHLIDRTDPPQCPGCGGPVTVKHHLTECPATAHLRDGWPTNIHEILGDNNKTLDTCINFIKITEFQI